MDAPRHDSLSDGRKMLLDPMNPRKSCMITTTGLASLSPLARAKPSLQSTNSPETLRLSIAGMRCAGCVESVETALRATEGVEKADVSFADHTAIVIGHPDPFALKAALKAAGYEGAIMTTEEDPNIESDLEMARYRDLLQKAGIAFLLAAPLMILEHLQLLPALGGGPIPSGFWILISLLTFWVMRISGGHFFTGAL